MKRKRGTGEERVRGGEGSLESELLVQGGVGTIADTTVLSRIIISRGRSSRGTLMFGRLLERVPTLLLVHVDSCVPIISISCRRRAVVVVPVIVPAVGGRVTAVRISRIGTNCPGAGPTERPIVIVVMQGSALGDQPLLSMSP